MDLSELFLSLAGFNTDLSTQHDVDGHPASRQLFTKAISFGNEISVLREITTANQDQPLAQFIKDKVEIAYLQTLSTQESLAIQKQMEGKPDPLILIADIVYNCVDTWESRIKFALRVLDRLIQPQTTQIEGLHQDLMKLNGSFEIRDLGTGCIATLDKAWVYNLKRELAECEGRFDIADLAKHFLITDSKVLLDSYSAMSKLTQITLSTKPEILAELLKLVKMNNETLDQLSVPLTRKQLATSLVEVHTQINAMVRQYFLKSEEITEMLNMLRKIVLFGSSEFALSYCSCDGNFLNCLPKSSAMNCSEDGKTLVPKWNQTNQFMINSQQWSLIMDIHYWLSKILRANNAIGVASGPQRHQYKVLFNALWQYYQTCLDNAFEALNSVIESDHSINICSEMDNVIEILGHEMSLDKSEFLQTVNSAIASSKTGESQNLDSLAREVQALLGIQIIKNYDEFRVVG